MKKAETKKEKEIKKQQIQKALQTLEEYKKNKITLKRPVFFVPGLTDEECKEWQKPYKSDFSIKQWIKETVSNYKQVTYITFTTEESEQCKSSIDFGRILKKRVKDIAGNSAFDIIGHSMGGLDIRTAITIYNLKNTFNCITVATPHTGTQGGGLRANLSFGLKKHHIEQCRNIDPDYKPIQTINKNKNRKLFLERIEKLYELAGTLDPLSAQRVYEINTKGLPADLCNKITTVEVSGATHSKRNSITRDVRAILTMLNILIGIEPEKPNYNYGYIFKD